MQNRIQKAIDYAVNRDPDQKLKLPVVAGGTRETIRNRYINLMTI